METINSSTKCYRIESTPDRKMASAMWRRAKFLGLPVRGWRDGGQCRVQIKATEWTVWRICNFARLEVEAAQAAALVAQVEAEALEYSGDAGYSDDSWADDEALTDDDGRYFDSQSLPYVLAIYDEARRRGLDAQWRRVDLTSTLWRVAVWEVSQEQFSDLLEVAGQAVAVAA
jgi:hypothetical protein